jgi:hypothetical protein
MSQRKEFGLMCLLRILVFMLLFVTGVRISGQVPAQDSGLEHGRDARESGYWVDPTTKLMWTRKDNGKDVNWRTAVKYCRELRLAGYSDWRLATIDELSGIYDDASAKGQTSVGERLSSETIVWAVKGDLILTGREWSSSRALDGRGRPMGGGAWLFDPFGGRRENELLGYYHGLRALCVRASGH